jgi:hypothetical protein
MKNPKPKLLMKNPKPKLLMKKTKPKPRPRPKPSTRYATPRRPPPPSRAGAPTRQLRSADSRARRTKLPAPRPPHPPLVLIGHAASLTPY